MAMRATHASPVIDDSREESYSRTNKFCSFPTRVNQRLYTKLYSIVHFNFGNSSVTVFGATKFKPVVLIYQVNDPSENFPWNNRSKQKRPVVPTDCSDFSTACSIKKCFVFRNNRSEQLVGTTSRDKTTGCSDQLFQKFDRLFH